MKPIQDFWCDYTPTDEELKDAIRIASENDCVVILRWFVEYNGDYRRVITKDSDFEKLKMDYQGFMECRSDA